MNFAEYVTVKRPKHLAEFLDLLSIASVSALTEHRHDVRRCADWLATMCTRIGLEHVAIMETGGHPLVYADWLHAPGAPTVLVYGHYDVQPPDPENEWVTPPFTPVIRDGKVYARGAADSKGCLFTHLKALEAILAVTGRLPCNVRLIIEGEEEISSPHLKPWLVKNQQLLQADVALNTDSVLYDVDTPAVCIGLRGVIGLEVTVQTAKQDLHSGVVGGLASSAPMVLAQLLSTVQDADGKVLVPGFYDDVLPLSPDEYRSWQTVPFNPEATAERYGLTTLVGDPAFTPLERNWARPTLDVAGIYGGYVQEGIKTVIPSRATAKLTCRTVPDQSGKKLIEQIERHLRRHCPSWAQLSVVPIGGQADPIWMSSDHPAIATALSALTDVYGRPSFPMRAGASVPVVEQMKRVLGLATVLLGFASPNEHMHAPNEHFHLRNFDRGIQVLYKFWHQLGKLSPQNL